MIITRYTEMTVEQHLTDEEHALFTIFEHLADKTDGIGETGTLSDLLMEPHVEEAYTKLYDKIMKKLPQSTLIRND